MCPPVGQIPYITINDGTDSFVVIQDGVRPKPNLWSITRCDVRHDTFVTKLTTTPKLTRGVDFIPHTIPTHMRSRILKHLNGKYIFV